MSHPCSISEGARHVNTHGRSNSDGEVHPGVRSCMMHVDPVTRNGHLREGPFSLISWGFLGAGDRTRTGDILLGRQTLYQLSYSRIRIGQSLLMSPTRRVYATCDRSAKRPGGCQHRRCAPTDTASGSVAGENWAKRAAKALHKRPRLGYTPKSEVRLLTFHRHSRSPVGVALARPAASLIAVSVPASAISSRVRRDVSVDMTTLSPPARRAMP